MDTRLIDRILCTISRTLKKINRDLRYDIITWSDYLGEHIKDIDPRKPHPRISCGGGTEMAKGMKYFKEHYGPEAILVLISDFCDSLDQWHEVERTMGKYSLWGFNYGNNRYSYKRGDWEWTNFKQRFFQTMDMTTREKIRNIIEIFYRPKFKIFNINSLDGKVFNHLEGVFVSLGITTSMKVMEDIAEVINTEDNGLKATITEISSKKVVNQYLNTVVKKTGVEQYLIPNLDEPGLLDKEASLNLLENLKQELTEEADLEDLKNLTPKISKLASLISKLDKSSGWDGHMIQEG